MTIRNALILAAALLGLSLLVLWAKGAGHLSETAAERLMQVATGLIVVYYGNLMPKTLEPLSQRCDPARVQALQRFSGRMLVLGGLGYAFAWIAVPPQHATPAGMAILGASVLVVLGRLVWTLRGGGGERPPARP